MTVASARIFLSAGEPSGDLHGAAVVRALRERLPHAALDAFGGPRMAEAGATVLFPMEGFAAFGLVEVIEKIPAHYLLLRRVERAFARNGYDLVILIDYPGFHLHVAEAARRAGIPVLYYIAPQLWAWRPQRAKRLAAACDRLAVILPFEEAFFRNVGVEADYVGHPLLDQGAPPTRAAARASLGIGVEERVLAMFPGSRTGEIRRLWPAMREAALTLLDRGIATRVVVAATDQPARAVTYPGSDRFMMVRGNAPGVLAAADAGIVKSGTSTLEAALTDTPMVVPYKVNAVHRIPHPAARDGKVGEPREPDRRPRGGARIPAGGAERGRASSRRLRRCSMRPTRRRWRSAKAWPWCASAWEHRAPPNASPTSLLRCSPHEDSASHRGRSVSLPGQSFPRSPAPGASSCQRHSRSRPTCAPVGWRSCWRAGMRNCSRSCGTGGASAWVWW